jgi:hypothetical protein
MEEKENIKFIKLIFVVVCINIVAIGLGLTGLSGIVFLLKWIVSIIKIYGVLK